MNNQTDTQDTFTVYTAGPDDVDHFDDELSALRYANAINRTYVADRLKHPEDDVLCVATVANGRAGTSPSLSDEDIADIARKTNCGWLIENYFINLLSFARAIEAKCRTLRAGQSEPVAPTLIRDAAERALAAYQHRFESVAPPMGNFVGPIDEEMQALRAALRSALPQTTGGEGS